MVSYYDIQSKFYLVPLLYSNQHLIRILFLSANPVDTPQLKVIQESNEINDKLRATRFRDQFELVQRHALSITDLQGILLEQDPQIVHFSGHGSQESALIFQNVAGQSEEVPPDALTNLFKILGRNIRCVVLNACYSEKQAKAIAKHVDSVVGMIRAISDDAATDFAVYFYQALGYGKSIKDAFDLGLNQLELSKIPEEQTPKLKVRDGVDPSNLVLVIGRSTNIPSPQPQERDSKTAILNINDVINQVKEKYDNLMDGNISIEEFWSAALPPLRKLSSDRETRLIIGSQNADSLNLFSINLATTMSNYRRSKDLGDEEEAALLNKKIMLTSAQVINRLDSIYLSISK
jgi:hypothetical protein